MILSHSKITLRQPDDWHLHLRDGKILEKIITSTTRVFRRAVVMPNLVPPVISVEDVINYKKRILAAVPKGISFTPLMTIYLTDSIPPDVLEYGYNNGIVFAAKLYPANSTTNSSQGVTDLRKITPVFETMERIGLPLLIHGEVTDKEVDIFDREAVFIERNLLPLLDRHPSLRIVLEHITTEDAVKFVENSGPNVAATITPHHLHINRNAMFNGGLRSDFYCLPVAKRERHRIALRKAATSGKPCFFLGTDSAPHLRAFKENSCGCAGIFNAPIALESYAEVFDQENSLDRLESFASIYGPKFYGLPINSNFITLRRIPQVVPDFVEVKTSDNSVEQILLFHAGETLGWSIAHE